MTSATADGVDCPELESLYDELTELWNALLAWDGVDPPADELERRVGRAEARIAAVEADLRRSA
jgi:hypothetical protein